MKIQYTKILPHRSADLETITAEKDVISTISDYHDVIATILENHLTHTGTNNKSRQKPETRSRYGDGF